MNTRGYRAETVGDVTRLRLVDGTLEDPAPHQVLIAVDAAAIGAPEIAGPAAHAVGGSCVGRVVAAGDAATSLVDARVAVGPVMPCGECDVCRRGAVAACPARVVLGMDTAGCAASHVLAHARWVCDLRAPLELPSPAAALLAREATTAYAMFVRSGIGPGDPVIVNGDNTIARLLLDIARAKGVTPLMLCRDDAWSALAASKQATAISIDAGDSSDDVYRRVEQAARTAGHGTRPWRVLVTGHELEHRRLALRLAGPGATVTLAGPPSVPATTTVPLDLSQLLANEASMIHVAAGHPDLIPEVAALAVRGELDLEGAAELVAEDALDAALARGGAEPAHAGTTVVVTTPGAS